MDKHAKEDGRAKSSVKNSFSKYMLLLFNYSKLIDWKIIFFVGGYFVNILSQMCNQHD